MKKCLCIFSFLFLMQSECALAKGLSLFFGADLQANVTEKADKLHGKNHVFGPQAGLSPSISAVGLFFWYWTDRYKLYGYSKSISTRYCRNA